MCETTEAIQWLSFAQGALQRSRCCPALGMGAAWTSLRAASPLWRTKPATCRCVPKLTFTGTEQDRKWLSIDKGLHSVLDV
eukprot:scaffold163727_cov15-Prasinocladus_malaysianus.AAC.1